MNYKGILFDLDGTLLPMDGDEFLRTYFGLLARTAAGYGYDKESLIAGLWKGVAAMVKNDGSRTNAEVFWAVFASLFGERVYRDKPIFDRFYVTEFRKAVTATSPSPLARELVSLASEWGCPVILATNPVFPRAGLLTRLDWAGLRAEDFVWITDYDNSTYSKPSPAYYAQILDRFGLDPACCLMVGNDVEEDILPPQSLGMDTYLVTDCRICRGEEPPTKRGALADLVAAFRRGSF